MIDIQELLTEPHAEPPCGPDLTYDNDFQAMENAARGKAEQQFGDTVIPTEPPDWRDVERQAMALMHRTKDVRIAALLCQAWTVLQGLPGTMQGLQLCATLLERHWDHVHPLPEDGDDYFMRMNALGTLSDVTGLMRNLRDTEFLRGALGQVQVRDAEALARGHAPESQPQVNADELRMAVTRAQTEGHAPLRALLPCLDAVAQIQSVCERHLPGHQQPELGALRQLLQDLQQWLPLENSNLELAPDVIVGEGQQTPSDTPTAGAPSVRNREQLIAQLLEIAALVERTEPANPAPLLIRRAARFMRMGFLEILRELSPDSLPQVETITGAQARDSQS